MKNFSISLFLIIILSACSKEDSEVKPTNTDNSLPSIPSTYSFERNNKSSVNYQGQKNRIQQLKELSAELKLADQGQNISSVRLINMYKNQGNPFQEVYGQQLFNKTFPLDTSYFLSLLMSAGQLSAVNQVASAGVAGRLTRSNGASILLDSNGRELTQLIEKGLMGAVFFHQVVNVYLSSNKIGPTVNNTLIDTNHNATDMEHHFDEAFGYMAFPIDFGSNYSGTSPLEFWAKYCASADPLLQSSDKLMSYYIQGRNAIVTKDYQKLDQMVLAINEEFEKVIAATAIHYINECINSSNTADLHHALSEAYAFIKALRYANALHRRIANTTVEDLLQNKIGENFYSTSTSNLIEAKNNLSSIYDLDAVKNAL